jgi:hypothetical protein
MQHDENILAGTLFNVKNHPIVEEYKYSGNFITSTINFLKTLL